MSKSNLIPGGKPRGGKSKRYTAYLMEFEEIALEQYLDKYRSSQERSLGLKQLIMIGLFEIHAQEKRIKYHCPDCDNLIEYSLDQTSSMMNLVWCPLCDVGFSPEEFANYQIERLIKND